LGEAFLDSRYELTATVARLGGGQNPVPQLFLNGWRRLSPVMSKALPPLLQQSAERYRNFIVAIDKLASVGQQGSRFGLLRISPDTLRSMARILQPSGGGDPIAYNLNVDGALRNLIGFGAPIGVRSPRSKQSGLRGLPFPLNVERVSLGSAHAAEADVKKLNQRTNSREAIWPARPTRRTTAARAIWRATALPNKTRSSRKSTRRFGTSFKR
jgi:hypothetical protein